jgi:peptidoglycan hydrolase-like protein with peptidoglycan-binding domain
MAHTGISQIDDLLGGSSPAPLGPADSTPEAVGLLQDLLIGHGFTNLPGMFGIARGTFGPQTATAVRTFQEAHPLAASGAVDAVTLNALIGTPATTPICSRGYLTLVLDVLFAGMARVMTVTTQFEGGGRFAAMNRNTDGAGLSFGLIQWAQKPGRLHELLVAFETSQPGPFVKVFGDGDAAVSSGLIAHTAKRQGGLTDTGETTDGSFDLVHEPWTSRFLAAGLQRELQRTQVDTALADFAQSFARVQLLAPQIRSERGIGFLLDVANQHGDGGLKSILETVSKPGLSEADLLAAVEEESVARVRAKFGDGPELRSTETRRHAFRTSPLISDEPLVLA